MPKIVDHDAYRKELLSQCFDLFAEQGYGSITMRQIAQGLKVSTGTLYHYFPSKEAIFEQLMESMAQQDISQVIETLKDTETVGERIEIAFAFIEENRDRLEKQTLLMADYYQHQQRQKGSRSKVIQQIEQQIKELVMNVMKIDDSDVVDLVLSLVDGLMFAKVYDGEPISIARQGKVLAKMVTAYMALKQLQV
ncbi:MAG TPA: TetR/AcrR family transcriptional regulator [Leptolyngbyaceae cyanobacterium M33_DOE_097]|uniref:TetR/AcrR family transcriptional regulator n=1 Tax=Oscillatoriales cyanobacterium SpSt-418 TaxID=2282169 RepID=A0A7C3PBM1_9CYAN|nr:TetR/AcrR family transcriptional regulator [Leptolyngbyaceae cyanobacterium M33_DOE_097]